METTSLATGLALVASVLCAAPVSPVMQRATREIIDGLVALAV